MQDIDRSEDNNKNTGKPRSVYIATYGCQMNVRDSEVIVGILKQAGFEVVGCEAEADVVIFNTCAVREHAEEKVWSEIGRIAKRGPRREAGGTEEVHSRRSIDHSKGINDKSCVNRISGTADDRKTIIGLVGCMAKNYAQAAFERSPFVDFVAGPQDIAKIPDILKSLENSKRYAPGSLLLERKIWEVDGDVRPEDIYHTGFRSDNKQAYVVISEGCSNHCSYCIVPYVRGPLRHRGQEDILREVREAAAQGVSRVFLLGQNVNSYRSGGKGDFVGLLEAVHAIEGVKEITFTSSHPRDSGTRLFKAIGGLERVRKWLHLPFQSGSDRILKAMNRGYNSKYYLELAREYRKIVPGGELSTDVIVGFPGETEEDFQATYRMVEEVHFNTAYIFKYSPRPHSRAAGLEDDVPRQEKERRHKLVLDLQKRISLSGKQRGKAK